MNKNWAATLFNIVYYFCQVVVFISWGLSLRNAWIIRIFSTSIYMYELDVDFADLYDLVNHPFKCLDLFETTGMFSTGDWCWPFGDLSYLSN